MKSCLAFLMTLIILFGIIGGGALLWYTSYTSTVTRKPAPGETGR